ncbi:MAG TPA: hypothetical protein VD905_22060, partial [Flavobacteriales bacterium]|nr:hypothetical protein [Flavobacteriales bacterium]
MIDLFISANLLLTQPDSGLQLTIVDTLHHKADFITTDPIGNLYLINNFTVNKYNAKGDSLFSQNFNQLRSIEYFDASQALKIYAVNFSFNSLFILDNTLTPQNQPITFEKIPVEQVTLLCASNFNNSVWVYDGVKMQLVKLDNNFRVTNFSVNFYSHADLSGIPNYMVESENNLYINIPENGIKVFNQFCNFVKNIPVKTEGKFIVRHQKVYYSEGGKIKFYNMFDFTYGELDLPFEGIQDFSIEKNKL